MCLDQLKVEMEMTVGHWTMSDQTFNTSDQSEKLILKSPSTKTLNFFLPKSLKSHLLPKSLKKTVRHNVQPLFK